MEQEQKRRERGVDATSVRSESVVAELWQVGRSEFLNDPVFLPPRSTARRDFVTRWAGVSAEPVELGRGLSGVLMLITRELGAALMGRASCRAIESCVSVR